ncbi:MAG: hypothetical protein Q7T57_00785 [Dehalococcoidales bacterium]|nr:hypothetical protein [Dehalococcoidales bacterium]
MDVYQWAAGLLGSSTKQHIVATDPTLMLSINGLFEEACDQSESSTFYRAWIKGALCLLKMPKSGSVARREAEVYNAVAAHHSGKQHLVPVTLLQLQLTSAGSVHTSTLPSDTALRMEMYLHTLAVIPREVAGLHAQLLSAGRSVYSALQALHASGFAHLDVKPSNIFVDGRGACFLGDYDAALRLDEPVGRTTDSYLPAEFAAMLRQTMLPACPAVDFAMLALTLADRLALPDSDSEKDKAAAVPSATAAATQTLWVNRPAFRRTLTSLSAATQSEAQRLVSSPKLAELPSHMREDVAARKAVLEVMQHALKEVNKADELLQIGTQLNDALMAKVGSASLSALPPQTLSDRTWSVSDLLS